MTQRKLNRYRDRVARRGIYRHARFAPEITPYERDTRTCDEAMADVADLAASFAGAGDPTELQQVRERAAALTREERDHD